MSRGKSVVVNCGDNPFLFNVSTGETVDRMQTRLSEVYSIPLDQQQLFVGLPQAFHQTEKDLSNLPFPDDFKVDFFRDFNVENFPFLPQVYDVVDYFILDLRPTLSSLLNRKVVLEYVKKTLSKCLGARAFCVGSSMNNVFLPDEMMEVTPFLCKGQEDKWVLRVNEGLCSAAFSSTEANLKGAPCVPVAEDSIDDSNITVNSVTFDCKSCCVLADINNMNVRISQNQLEALYNGALLEDINFMCKKSSLFKKSLLLIKSWCSYDSKQFSPNGKTVYPDVLPPFVLDIMVVHIISRYGDAIEHPLHTLGLFLQFFAFIDFNSVVITMTDLLDVLTMEPLIDDELKVIREQKLSNEINMKYRVLFNGYRHRYEATVTANRRAKEDSVTVAESIAQTTESGSVEEAIEKNKTPGISWGISSDNPSLTMDFKPAPGTVSAPPVGSNGGSGGIKTGGGSLLFKEDSKKNAETFPRSFMNVIGPFKPSSNIAINLKAADTHELTSLLQCGLKRFEQTMRTCRLAADDPRGCVAMGEGVDIPIESFFIGECFGLSRDKIVVEKKLHDKVNRSDADAIEELRMSKYYCEVESPEDVLRHAELIMGSKITADAVANLIVHIIEQMGPLPIGEIGKLLQEFTGNQNLSRILKSQFRGLKKLIEGYPSSLMVGGDHNFNPHVYLARTKAQTAANDPWIDDKKVHASPDMVQRECVPPPALQVHHEQMVHQQQQQKTRGKQQQILPVAQPRPPAPPAPAPARDEPPMSFQLSASSPAFVAPNNNSDPWRNPQNLGNRGGGGGGGGNIAAVTSHRERRLPSGYYADDRLEATETGFLSNDIYRGGDNGYPLSSSGHPRGGGKQDMDDRAKYAPRGLSYNGGSRVGGGDSDGMNRSNVQYQESVYQQQLQSQQTQQQLQQQQQKLLPQDKAQLTSLMGLGYAAGGLDQEYASSHYDVLSGHGSRQQQQSPKKLTPADYINGLNSDNLSGVSNSGRYSREVNSNRDGVSSIFSGDYSQPDDRQADRHVDRRHMDRHFDRQQSMDRHADRQGDRHGGGGGGGDRHGGGGDRLPPDRRHGVGHLDPYYLHDEGAYQQDYDHMSSSRGGGGSGGRPSHIGSGGPGNGPVHHFYPQNQPHHVHANYPREDGRGGGGGGGSRDRDQSDESNYHRGGGHSPVDPNMLPYFLRDS